MHPIQHSRQLIYQAHVVHTGTRSKHTAEDRRWAYLHLMIDYLLFIVFYGRLFQRSGEGERCITSACTNMYKCEKSPTRAALVYRGSCAVDISCSSWHVVHGKQLRSEVGTVAFLPVLDKNALLRSRLCC